MTQNRGELWETYPLTGQPFRYQMAEQGSYVTIDLEGGTPEGLPSTFNLSIMSGQAGEGLCRTESGLTCAFAWAWVGAELQLWLDGDLFVFQRSETRGRSRAATTRESGDVVAPMPGAVLEVLVSNGDRVERNQALVLLESMKMELVISAPCDGYVRRVAVQPGQQVDRGMRLLEMAAEEDTG